MSYIERTSESNIEQKMFEILQNGYILRFNQTSGTNSNGDITYTCNEYWFDDINLINDITALNNQPYDVNGWQSGSCNLRIVAPITLVNSYPQLLFDLTVIRKLQLEQSGNNVYIYCNYIEPEHKAIIDGSGGLIYVENKSNII